MKRWDIIGDVHGSAAALQVLLTRLGYTEAGGVRCHPSRQALFIGDLVDRGPGVGETLTLVRAMVDAGIARAILGNHEYNALCRRHDEAHRPVAGLQGSMWVCGFESWWFMSAYPGMPPLLIEVKRDDKWIARTEILMAEFLDALDHVHAEIIKKWT